MSLSVAKLYQRVGETAMNEVLEGLAVEINRYCFRCLFNNGLISLP